MFNYRVRASCSIILLCCCLTWKSSRLASGEVRLPEDEEEILGTHSKNVDSIIRGSPSFGRIFGSHCQEYSVNRRERSNNEEIDNPEEADDDSLTMRSYNDANGGEEVIKMPEENKNSSSGFFRGIENFFHRIKSNITTSKLPSTTLKPEELSRKLAHDENVKQQRYRNLLKNKIPVKNDRRATFDFQIKAVPINNKKSLA